VFTDHSPEVYRRAPVVKSSPAPPVPPAADPPTLRRSNDMNSTDDASGFGPPAALMRWQRPRAKSEFQRPELSQLQTEREREKRMSSTLPFSATHSFTFDAKDYSKDDTEVDKVSKSYSETVSVSKPLKSQPKPYHFKDSSRIEEWQQQQEQQRMVGDI